MKFRQATTLAALVFLFVITHRLPAPISEETTPKPEATAKPKAKAKASNQSHQNAAGRSPFVGTWNGSVNVVGNNGSTDTWNFVVTVSSDAKIAWTKWKLANDTWGATFPATCQGDGNQISWSFGGTRKGTLASHSFILRFNSDRSAVLTYHGAVSSGSASGFTADGTGVMTKQ